MGIYKLLAKFGTPGSTARTIASQYLKVKQEKPDLSDLEILDMILEARNAALPYSPLQYTRLLEAVAGCNLAEFILQVILVESNVQEFELPAGQLDDLRAVISGELSKRGLGREASTADLGSYVSKSNQEELERIRRLKEKKD